MSEPFLGEIRIFGGNFAPRGWAFCNGQLLPIAQNTALFSILGTFYGGNGTTTFALPNLQGRSPVGMGAGAGLTPITLGEVAGTENVTILSSQLPPATLPINATANVAVPVNTGNGTSTTPSTNSVLSKTNDSAAGAEVNLYSAGPATSTLASFNAPVSGSVTFNGGGAPLPIRNPFLGMNFIIALEGIYPTRN